MTKLITDEQRAQLAVVEADDVVGNVPCRLGVVCIVALPNALHLQVQVQEEALHDRVVPAIGLAAHAGAQAMARQ